MNLLCYNASSHHCLMYHRYSQGSNSAVSIANSVQAFITTMDSLKLNMAAVDQVGSTMRHGYLGLRKVGPSLCT